MNKKLNIPKPLHEYAILTFASFLMGFGIYFFRFPNNFSFGGVTGIAVIMAKAIPLSASTITFILNILLLILGVVVLGKSFGINTQQIRSHKHRNRTSPCRLPCCGIRVHVQHQDRTVLRTRLVLEEPCYRQRYRKHQQVQGVHHCLPRPR